MSVLYHPKKANVVADAFSRVSMGSVTLVVDEKKDLMKEFHRLARLGVRLEDSPKGGFMVRHNSQSSLVVRVKSKKKHLDSLLMELNETVLSKSMSLSLEEKMGCLGI